MSSFVVKVVLNEDVRRLPQKTNDFGQLRASIVEAYGLPASQELSLRYEDSDGDLITLASTPELAEAINQQPKNQVLKLFVTLKNNGSTPAPSAKVTAAPTLPVKKLVTVESVPDSPVVKSNKTVPAQPAAQQAAAPVPPSVSAVAAESAASAPKVSDPSGLEVPCEALLRAQLESFAADAGVAASLPDVLQVVLDGLSSGSPISTIVDLVLAVSAPIRDHPLTQTLLPFVDKLQSAFEASPCRAFVSRLNDPMLRQFVFSMAPVFLVNSAQHSAHLHHILVAIANGQKPSFGSFCGRRFAESHTAASATSVPPQASTQQSQPAQPDPAQVFPQVVQGMIDDLFGAGSGRVGEEHGRNFVSGLSGALNSADAGIQSALANIFGTPQQQPSPAAASGCPMRGGHHGIWRRGCGRRFDQEQRARQQSTPQQGPLPNVSATAAAPVRSLLESILSLLPEATSTAPQAAAAPSTATTTTDSTSNVVHSSVICDGCGVSPIRGIRYKCQVCSDFDLCESCEAKGVHPLEHALSKIRVPGSNRAHFGGRSHHGHCGGRGWRHHRAAAEAASASSLAVTATPSAAFVCDVNLVDRTEVFPSMSLVKTWRLMNDGTIEWPEGSKLIFLRGDRQLLGETEEFPVPPAKVGETIEVSVLAVTPQQPGRVTAYFRLSDANRNCFGPRIWLDLIVAKELTSTKPSPTQTAAAAPVAQEETKPTEIKDAIVLPPAQQQPSPVTESVSVSPLQVAEPSSPSTEFEDDAVLVEQTTPVATPIPVSVPEHPYAVQLSALASMGFSDSNLNSALLHQFDGNLQSVANVLLNQALGQR